MHFRRILPAYLLNYARQVNGSRGIPKERFLRRDTSRIVFPFDGQNHAQSHPGYITPPSLLPEVVQRRIRNGEHLVVRPFLLGQREQLTAQWIGYHRRAAALADVTMALKEAGYT